MSGTLIIGEAYGQYETTWGAPFVGASGIELNTELADAGFLSPNVAAAINKALYRARDAGTRRGRDGNFEVIPWDELRPWVQQLIRGAVADRDRLFRAAGLYLANCIAERPPGNKISAFFFTKTEGKKTGTPPLHSRYPKPNLRAGIDSLTRLISRTHPSLIIVLGGTSLWALTGRDGIERWRSSQLVYCGEDGYQCPLIPTIHPAAVVRDWPWRPIVVHDLKRALHVRDNHPPGTDWDFTIRPSYECAMDYLSQLQHERDSPLTADTETIGGHITCISFADSPRRAICIPFLDPGAEDGSANYWPDVDMEMQVLRGVKQVLCSRPIVFHNGIYDCQVTQNDWGFLPQWTDDTMIAQHVAFPGFFGAGIDPVTGETTKKGSSLSLAFCASMYCKHYVFWKDDGRLWDPNTIPPEQHWQYNCEDSARTFECHEALQRILSDAGLLPQYHFQMRQIGPATLRIMRRGIRVDIEARRAALASAHQQLTGLEGWFQRVLGHPLNPQSSPQMKTLFYDDFRCAPQYTGKGEDRRLSCDDEALTAICRKRPELLPLITRCQDYRTLAVLGGKAVAANRSFLTCRLSDDNDFRFTLNPCGAETMRFSGGPNAFGEGCNPQNIAKG